MAGGPRDEVRSVYEAAFLDHPSSVCILRLADLVFVAVNPEFERASGRRVADLIGRRPDEIGLIDPEDAAALLREVAALVERGDPAIRDYVTRIRYRLPDGEESFARMAVGLTEIDGKPHLLAAFTDASLAVSQERALGRRDSILQTVGAAAQLFLQVDRWEVAIDEVLRRLGEAAEVSRAHVFENVMLAGGQTGARTGSSGARPVSNLSSATRRRSTSRSTRRRRDGNRRSAGANRGW